MKNGSSMFNNTNGELIMLKLTMLKNVRRNQGFMIYRGSPTYYKGGFDRKMGRYCCQSRDAVAIFYIRGTSMVWVSCANA